MALTRLQNIISSVEGRILYVNPDDFDSTDGIDNKGNSPLRPFKTIARAMLEVARYSYVSAGTADDKFDQFTILLYPGDHIVDNRPGDYAYKLDNGNFVASISTTFTSTPVVGNFGWNAITKEYSDLYRVTNSPRGGLIVPRGVSIIGLDLRKTKIRPKFVPSIGSNSATKTRTITYDVLASTPNQITLTSVSGEASGDEGNINSLYIGSIFDTGVQDATGANVILPGTTITGVESLGANVVVSISKPHLYTSDINSNTATLSVPFDDDNSRSAIFKITGGCYFWQFSIFDGDPAGIYQNSQTIIPQNSWNITKSDKSHTRLTVFEYATLHELEVFYRKISDAITLITADKIEPRIQENRIVGPLADTVGIVQVQRNNNVVTVTLESELNLTEGNFVKISGEVTGIPNFDGVYTGEKQVSSVPSKNQFVYILSTAEVSVLSGEDDADGGTAGVQITYATNPDLVSVEVEIDTVESASPYIFNISMRSVYGMCGMHADGSRATGFKSMVVAQYTGISLQKKDEAFTLYNGSEYTPQSAGSGAHTNPEVIYLPTERSYHIKASNRAVIQAVSVFAVGFADHFLAVNGGDMSITNSNSNFGSNALISSGFSDVAFEKDSLGTITHIIPPRNIESNLKNIFWETINVDKTLNSIAPDARLYLNGREDILVIDTAGTDFTLNASYNVLLNNVDTNITATVTGLGRNGSVTTLNLPSIGSLQPGDRVTIENNTPGSAPCTFIIGGALTSKAGIFNVGERSLDKFQNTVAETVKIPLFANSTATAQTLQEATIVKNIGNNNVFEYDNNLNNWYVSVSTTNNNIYTALFNNTKYGSANNGIVVTPTSFLERFVDERLDDDKIYRLRYVTRKNGNRLPAFPQTGYIIQPKRGSDILGLGDRFTDASNLLLLNKAAMANEVVARFKSSVGALNNPNADSTKQCVSDLISIIETVAHNIRYGGNDKVHDGASLYLSGGIAASAIQGERDQTVQMINSDTSSGDSFDGLKVLMANVINNNQTGSPVNARSYGSKVAGTQGTEDIGPVYITGEEQLINVSGGCTNAVTAANTLLDIYVSGLGSDNAVPTSLGVTRTTTGLAGSSVNYEISPDGVNVYDRIKGHDYNDVYYIYEVEEAVPYSYNEQDDIEVPGVYYLTVLKGSVDLDQVILPNNTYKFSQNVNNLYPNLSIDNVVSDPIVARSAAVGDLIGKVVTSDGRNDVTNEDTSFSITKEAVSTFLDEYLNNELQWIWDGKETASTLVTNTRYPNPQDATSYQEVFEVIETELRSGNGTPESRKIEILPGSPVFGYEVELRRPSTIRSGNHTFEYVGFGPGNYSTAFPLKQNKVLSDEAQKYAQSIKLAGGIAFYSGLNSNGDLFIGNTVINAVSGKTTENQIEELTRLVIGENLNILGGAGNTIASNFQGPVNFTGGIDADGSDYVFSNIQLRDSSGFTTKLTSSDATVLPPISETTLGDINFNNNPSRESSVGFIYTDDYDPEEFVEFGLIGTERIHSYRSGTDPNYEYTLCVGGEPGISNSNLNYHLDVTTNQRIGSYLDIGNLVSDSVTSNTSTKETKLQIIQRPNNISISDYTGIEIKNTVFNADAKFLNCINQSNNSVFTVKSNGDVVIPPESNYGLAKRAWSCNLTVDPTNNNFGDNLVVIQPLLTNYWDGVADDDLPKLYTGTTISNLNATAVRNRLGSGFVYRISASLSSFTFVGSPGQLTQYASNSNSVLIFINGVLQEPYKDIYFDGEFIYFNLVSPQPGDRISVRGLAT